MPHISLINHAAIIALKKAFFNLSWREQLNFPLELSGLLIRYPEDITAPEDNAKAAHYAFLICAAYKPQGQFDCIDEFSRTSLAMGVDKLHAAGLLPYTSFYGPIANVLMGWKALDMKTFHTFSARLRELDIVTEDLFQTSSRLIQANSDALANFDVLSRSESPSLTAAAFARLHKSGVFAEEFSKEEREFILNAFSKSRNSVKLSYALVALYKSGFLTGDFARVHRRIILESLLETNTPSLVSEPLIILHKAGLLTGDSADSNYDDFTGVVYTQEYSLGVMRVLTVLGKANLLNQANYDAFMSGFYTYTPENTMKALIQLGDAGLFVGPDAQVNFDIFMNTLSESSLGIYFRGSFPLMMSETLVRLHQAGLLMNYDVLKVCFASNDPLAVARLLINLSETGVFNQANYNALITSLNKDNSKNIIDTLIQLDEADLFTGNHAQANFDVFITGLAQYSPEKIRDGFMVEYANLTGLPPSLDAVFSTDKFLPRMCKALIALNNTDLLKGDFAQKNYQALNAFLVGKDSFWMAQALILLCEAGLLTGVDAQKNFDVLMAAHSHELSSMSLIALHKAGALTGDSAQNNYDKYMGVMVGKHSLRFIRVLLELDYTGLLNQDYYAVSDIIKVLTQQDEAGLFAEPDAQANFDIFMKGLNEAAWLRDYPKHRFLFMMSEALVILYQAGLLAGNANREALNTCLSKNNPMRVARTLIRLHKKGFFSGDATQKNYNFFMSVGAGEHTLRAMDIFSKLSEDGILNQANYDAFIACCNKYNASEIIDALIKLDKAGLFSGDYAQANFDIFMTGLTQYSSEKILDEHRAMNAVFFESDPPNISKDEFLSRLCKALLTLNKTGLLTGNFAQKNYHALNACLVRKEPFGMAAALTVLYEEGLLTGEGAQNNFDVLTAEHSHVMIVAPLIVLHKAGLLIGDSAQVYRDALLLKGNDLAALVAIHVGLATLMGSNLLNQANFERIIIPYASLIFNKQMMVLWQCMSAPPTQANLEALCQQPATEEEIKQRTIDFLLSDVRIFSMAILHIHELEYVVPFITKKLTTLRVQKEALRANEPNRVFNLVDPQEVDLSHQIMCHFVRSNERHWDDDLRFLLSIPAVKEYIINDQSNELLRLALTTGNHEAAAILLTIPALRQRAERHNYYREEAHGQLDLAALARDHESSMHALTSGEKNRLREVTEHYQPVITEQGLEFLMQDLRAQLKARYLQNPAKLPNEQELPLEYEAFTALNLNAEERQSALEAYYSHKDHSALRYLSKPNLWISAEANYVYVDEANRNLRWSSFEEYQPLIVMLWLAAKDEHIAPTDDHTLAGRLEHFIDELAHIGRAHNWDNTREREDGVEEEYDDLRGDKPSCYSGVKRRLFQSVVGHPFLKVISLEDMKQELREFVRTHFKACINSENQAALKAAYDNYLINIDFEEAAPLKALDIPLAKQEEFFAFLMQKYGEQFHDDPSLKKYLKDKFSLRENNGRPVDYAHALKFADFGLQGLLTAPAANVSASQAGFFSASAAPAGDEESSKAGPSAPSASGH